MKKEVFIIHRSEIVRKGLNAILRSYFNVDVTQLSQMEDLEAFGELKQSQVIVFSGPFDDAAMKHLHRIRKANSVHLVCLSGKGEGPAGISGNYHHLSMDAPADAIHALVAELFNGGQTTGDVGPADSELTVRERDVLSLVAVGHSNKEIAEKLFISVHTVISHRKNITEKLGIKSISGLTVYAILNRIIDPERLDTDLLI